MTNKRFALQWLWPWHFPAWNMVDYGSHITMEPDPFRLAWWRIKSCRMLDEKTGREARYVQVLGLEVLLFDRPVESEIQS